MLELIYMPTTIVNFNFFVTISGIIVHDVVFVTLMQRPRLQVLMKEMMQ